MPQYSKKPIWGQHAAHLPEKYVSDLWDELHKLEEPIDHLFMRPAAATGKFLRLMIVCFEFHAR